MADKKQKRAVKTAVVKPDMQAPQELPPAIPQPPAQRFHFLLPSAVLKAKPEALTKLIAFVQSMRGYGVSAGAYEKMPKDVRALFEAETRANGEFNPIEYIG